MIRRRLPPGLSWSIRSHELLPFFTFEWRIGNVHGWGRAGSYRRARRILRRQVRQVARDGQLPGFSKPAN